MDNVQLQEAAREALKEYGASQSDAARALDVNRSAISMALNHSPPSRYAGTLRRIVETYTDFRIETETKTISVHRVEHKER